MDRRKFIVSLGLSGVVAGLVESSPDVRMEERIAWWCCELNHWEWPKDWGEKPDWIVKKFSQPTTRECVDYERKRYSALLDGLRQAVGEKEVSRVWNTKYRRHNPMLEAEFEEWYKTRRLS